MGTLVSNFTLIRAGALQRANGGFLILDALKVIAQPYAWEGLERTLQAGAVRIESLAELIGLSSALQLEPEPVPLGDSSFAHPVRITATVRMGEGEVVDIEREVELGGPIHSKGVLILSAFLSARFGARLSALSGVPIRQGVAVTGSVNQFGVVQAVGGINEKIEGFFDICAGRGLSGEQGVLIPAANACHLMLRADVCEAARAGRFRIWAVRSVDEAVALLTGEPAGAPEVDGLMAPGSVNGRAAARLAELARARQEFAHPRHAGSAPDAGR